MLGIQTIVNVATVFVLAYWLLQTIYIQIIFDKFRKKPKGSIFIPHWNFFGPRPGMFDLQLLYRDHLSHPMYSAWHHVVLAPPRALHNIFWNPGRRVRKALFDLVVSLRAVPQTEEALRISIPYLAIMNYVSFLPHVEDVIGTQFAILLLDFNNDRTPDIVVVSEIFALPRI